MVCHQHLSVLVALHVGKSALKTDEKCGHIKSEILKSPLISWQLCDFFSRMKYVCLMKHHVAYTIFVFIHCQTFFSTLFLILSVETLNIVWFCWIFAGLWQFFFLSEDFFSAKSNGHITGSNSYFPLFSLYQLQYSTTTNDCYSQRTLKGIFNKKFLYVIYWFCVWSSPHRETFLLFNINITKDQKCLLVSVLFFFWGDYKKEKKSLQVKLLLLWKHFRTEVYTHRFVVFCMIVTLMFFRSN